MSGSPFVLSSEVIGVKKTDSIVFVFHVQNFGEVPVGIREILVDWSPEGESMESILTSKATLVVGVGGKVELADTRPHRIHNTATVYSRSGRIGGSEVRAGLIGFTATEGAINPVGSEVFLTRLVGASVMLVTPQDEVRITPGNTLQIGVGTLTPGALALTVRGFEIYG